ncbi:hypothetical protein [Deinococcus multiflagellatus]|uniref:hypothetical protein n=1 Tax=Deinococcus multiflagellatus TaxID=1656887 RepID=UPI001CCA5BA3|nr:hypothetical protein [Deinococcus multiflagellatus]MBZ9714033.1 hypothetical protein [Deinococcus multiflagellatus]
MLTRLQTWWRRLLGRPAPPSPDSPRDGDDPGGAGVLVPAGPRPRRDGAQATPPAKSQP